MRLVRHEPFLLKLEEGLADRAAADCELAREVVLNEACAWREPAGEDGFADRIDNVVHQDAALAGRDRVVECVVGHRHCLQFTAGFANPRRVVA